MSSTPPRRGRTGRAASPNRLPDRNATHLVATGAELVEMPMIELDACALFGVGDEADFNLGVEFGIELPLGSDVPGQHQASGRFRDQHAAQSQVLSSSPRSYQRLPTRGSTIAWRAGDASTIIVLRTRLGSNSFVVCCVTIRALSREARLVTWTRSHLRRNSARPTLRDASPRQRQTRSCRALSAAPVNGRILPRHFARRRFRASPR